MKHDINKMLITLHQARERYTGAHNKEIQILLDAIILLLNKLENLLKGD